MMFLSLLFFVPFFVYGVDCFFFFANDSLQHQYSSWRINRWLLRKQLVLAVTKFSIDKIVRHVLIHCTNDIVPKISRYKGNK